MEGGEAMSMLSSQSDELREAARNIQGNLGRCLYRRKDVDEMQQVSGMLFEAADTIESMRDRLQAAELGGGECDAILDESYYKGIHGYCECLKCSNCGEPLFSEFKSCPWCGKRIREKVDE